MLQDIGACELVQNSWKHGAVLAPLQYNDESAAAHLSILASSYNLSLINFFLPQREIHIYLYDFGLKNVK